MAERDAAVAAGEFDTIGQLAVVHTLQGTAMDFRKSGPMVGQLADGSLVILSEWAGLPDIPSALDQPCPDCLTECDECVKGKRNCTAQGCGGAGQVKTPVTCPDCKKLGRNNPECKTCRGIGTLDKFSACKVCKGSGVVACALCRGTGRMNTGTASGRVEKRGRPPEPVCKTCNGAKRKLKSKSQSMQAFQFSQVEGHPCYGPILKLLFHGMRGDAGPSTVEVLPDTGGNYMVLMLDRLGGRRAYLMGGVPRGAKIVQQASA